ncbi:MAG TPA: CHY zinc finger protein [Rhizomicrobium sp.]|nr:CHY zinc finger protein [Rhizomicrobium sp.]
MPLRPAVLGLNVDPETRCAHYHSPRDVVAIRMKCCNVWYACRDCHDALAGHVAQQWPRAERDVTAILCGVCGAQTSIRSYLKSADACLFCDAPFNPGCREHHHLYFEM